MTPNLNVFINCPFDGAYSRLFQAIYFTIVASGYQPRCALEDGDGFEIRIRKLSKIIGECERSVHDLSRVQLGDGGLPRFNMPFELGLMMGAKLFGSDDHKSKSALVLISEAYRLPAYLSDLGGNDPRPHGDDPKKAIAEVRRYLGVWPGGAPLPGAKHIHDAFLVFQDELPGMVSAAKLEVDEVDAFDDFKTFAHFVSAFLVNKPVG